MSFDGIVTKAVVHEFEETVIGSKIDKIYQQERDEILIHLHKTGQNYKLLISASSNNPRIYITDHTKQNPSSPPMFCMLLRKYLVGGIITDVQQYSLDRIVCIKIKTINEMGELSIKNLIVEIMGKHSNIILVNDDSKTIIDSIKRITPQISRVRQVLPRLNYEFPPKQDKINPLYVDEVLFMERMKNSSKNIPVFKFLYTNFTGLSPLISREICYKSSIDERKTVEDLNSSETKKLFNTFSDLMKDIKQNKYTPNIVYNLNNDGILAFHALKLTQFGDMVTINNSSMSQILEKYYYEKDLIDRIGQKSLSMKKSIQVKLDRAINKYAKQKEELIEAKNRDDYKIYADLISSNIHKITKGMGSIELENFYTNNLDKITIKLDPKLSAVENAQKNYKKYAKLKNAEKLLESQIKQNKSEIEYLENVMVSIDNCMEIEELDEIKEELINEGYLRGTSRIKNKRKKQKLSKPYHYISSDGFHIYVGKNNVQNDHLTLKFANKDDLWLHTKDIPGSHVIVRAENKIIPKNTIYEAAILAAYYSKARNSQNVPVDYTLKKNVKKPSGAKPGMVIYENHSTCFINPSKNLVENIKKVEN